MMKKKVEVVDLNTTKGVTGFILSLFGILLVWMPYFSVFFSVAGLILGSKQNSEYKTGLGTASFVIGLIGVIISGILLLLLMLGILMILAGL